MHSGPNVWYSPSIRSDICNDRKFGGSRGTHLDLRVARQRIEIVLCDQRHPFLNRVAHLSLLLPAASTIPGGDLGYAATIAPGCCGDAAPKRRDSGCVLGRSEIVSRLCEAQEFS